MTLRNFRACSFLVAPTVGELSVAAEVSSVSLPCHLETTATLSPNIMIRDTGRSMSLNRLPVTDTPVQMRYA